MPCIAKFAEHQFFDFLNTDGDNQPWFNRWGREMYQPNRYWVERSVPVVAFILTAPPAVEARLSEPSSTKQATDSESEAIAALKPANSVISVGFIATAQIHPYTRSGHMYRITLRREVFMEWTFANADTEDTAPRRCFRNLSPPCLEHLRGKWKAERVKCKENGGLLDLGNGYKMERWKGDWRKALWLMFP